LPRAASLFNLALCPSSRRLDCLLNQASCHPKLNLLWTTMHTATLQSRSRRSLQQSKLQSVSNTLVLHSSPGSTVPSRPRKLGFGRSWQKGRVSLAMLTSTVVHVPTHKP
jgi:hypothetical protein